MTKWATIKVTRSDEQQEKCGNISIKTFSNFGTKACLGTKIMLRAFKTLMWATVSLSIVWKCGIYRIFCVIVMKNLSLKIFAGVKFTKLAIKKNEKIDVTSRYSILAGDGGEDTCCPHVQLGTFCCLSCSSLSLLCQQCSGRWKFSVLWHFISILPTASSSIHLLCEVV